MPRPPPRGRRRPVKSHRGWYEGSARPVGRSSGWRGLGSPPPRTAGTAPGGLLRPTAGPSTRTAWRTSAVAEVTTPPADEVTIAGRTFTLGAVYAHRPRVYGHRPRRLLRYDPDSPLPGGRI